MRGLNSPKVIYVEDPRKLAKRRLPKVIFDYLDGGAEAELTMRANCRVFDDIVFRPRSASSVGVCDLTTAVLGATLSFPAILAPIGYSRLMHPKGEMAAARAAGVAGIGYVLSAVSGYRLEEVRAASPGLMWYQLYLIGGRKTAEAAIERAHTAGHTALVITVDPPVAGMRERDFRNGAKELLGGHPMSKLAYLPNILFHPVWLGAFLRDGGVPALENIVLSSKGPMRLVDVPAALRTAAVTWKDVTWIRQVWTGPIVVKGILTGEDAQRAVDEGAAAVVVSNHGGRQLDSVSPSLRALPEVVDAVGSQTEILMDGGIRRGSDILKALCLGARAVLVGRAYAYGLAAAGEDGVTRTLQILRDDIERTLQLLGCETVAELTSAYISYCSPANLTQMRKFS